MYNKISSIILNTGKASSFSDVFVAQPDSLKESLAGKIFIIADIGGKKTDGRKIFDFLISSLNNTYYNDEKILLRDKIEGLKVENIFEAAISKTNKGLNEFLVAEKIKLSNSNTNLTIGVIFENKLYFAGFGKNRALLIYRHNDQYEIINVEANAADVNLNNESGDRTIFAVPSLFSSVISGEIPVGSYFVFSSEALPEYISSKDMIGIITKLPPIVAAEQIKNILSKINSFIPFLGIIIKNTIGVDNQEIREEAEENLSAHSSISTLNYTEQKTERMLEPAGLISFGKMYKGFFRLIKDLQPKPKPQSKKIYRSEEDRQSPAPVEIPIDLGKVKSLNVARADSFLIKEQIFFKKKPSQFFLKLSQLFSNIPNIFNLKIFAGLKANTNNWVSGLNKNNRSLLIGLGAVVFIFLASIGLTSWNKQQKAAQNNYNNLISAIDEKQNEIDNYLAYGNEDGAKNALIETRSLLSYLPHEKKDQALIYSRLEEKINAKADKLEKIIKIDNPEKANDLSGLNISNIVWASGNLYASNQNTIYSVVPQSSSSTKFDIAGISGLNNAQFDGVGNLYYWGVNNLVKFDLKTKQSSLIDIPTEFKGATSASFKIYNKKLYFLAKDKNQIYKANPEVDGSYKTKAEYLTSLNDLSTASDFSISFTSNGVNSGRIFILKTNGQVLKYLSGKPVAYKSTPVSPAISSASKIVIGTKYVYSFDASAKRLVAISAEDGSLVNQYQISSLSAPKDFSVDESGKTAYVLDSEAIYKIPLSQ